MRWPFQKKKGPKEILPTTVERLEKGMEMPKNGDFFTCCKHVELWSYSQPEKIANEAWLLGPLARFLEFSGTMKGVRPENPFVKWMLICPNCGQELFKKNRKEEVWNGLLGNPMIWNVGDLAEGEKA